MSGEGELRCFCSRKPLLGKFGRGRDGKAFVHVKVFKQARVFGEFIFTEGVVRILCRECLRWHVIRIQPTDRQSIEFQQEELPAEISV